MAASGAGGGDGVPTLPLSALQNPKVASLHFIELRYYLTNIYFTHLQDALVCVWVRVGERARGCECLRLPTYVVTAYL